jgi:hypothetical protein
MNACMHACMHACARKEDRERSKSKISIQRAITNDASSSPLLLVQ